MRNLIHALVLCAAPGAQAFAVDVPASTLANLQAAYESESNAAGSWHAFARKAEEEGFPYVASVFRAIARGDEVHANNHAAAIRLLGQEPRASVGPVVVRDTRENLEFAIAQESFARDATYPTYLATAREIRDATPIPVLRSALFAERMHVKLYQDALGTLDLPGRIHNDDLRVCRRCGHVSLSAGSHACADGSMTRTLPEPVGDRDVPAAAD